jgi:hypothetical protein
MEKQAMRFLNLVETNFSAWLFYGFSASRPSRLFRRLRPVGDFDLIFGAAKFTLKITDLPIRYRERTYGTTNTSGLNIDDPHTTQVRLRIIQQKKFLRQIYQEWYRARRCFITSLSRDVFLRRLYAVCGRAAWYQ